jgi:hypothetical protein
MCWVSLASLGNTRLPDMVQQRSLAMIDMAHDCHDRRPGNLLTGQLFNIFSSKFLLDIRASAATALWPISSTTRVAVCVQRR